VRERAERKRLTALHREAQHERVLRATRHFDGSSVSTLLILRATALRWLGSLDDAVALADEAFARARREEHAVRTAHAAFQKAIALLWAQRVDECSRCLEDELRPFASLAANRWVAWSHFIAGGLAVRAGQPDAALRAFELGETLFRAEALMDGVVSIRLARLTALRLAEQDDVFRGHANELRSQQALDDGRDWRWYARSSNISVLALHLEEGEFARGREHDRVTAQRHFGVVASTRYPLYKSLGQLGLALSVSSPIERSRWTQAARATAGDIGARLVEARATEILAGKATADRPVFFC
jgi:hypothetical protein